MKRILMFNEAFSNSEIDNIKDYLIYIEDDLNLITNTSYSQGSKEITIKGEECKQIECVLLPNY